jgi:hypothetical protein
MEDLLVRHRNRMRHHYTTTSNVLLFGYKQLSDAAKITYQVVDSFDWEGERGLRKGYAYPAIQRIARARGLSVRAVQRHLAELETVGLLEREFRYHQTTLLFINDPSEAETKAYLASLTEQSDKNVTLLVTRQSDKNVTQRNTNSPEENKNVNVEELNNRRGEPEALGQIVNRYANGYDATRRRDLRQEETARREYLASEMLALLGDEHSLGYYRKVASEYSPQVIFEVLGLVKELAQERLIRKTRGATFVALLRERHRPHGKKMPD